MAIALTFNIPEEVLSGTIGSTRIDCRAAAGGRAGTKTANAENWYLKSNVFATGIHHGQHTYGPLPLGQYSMRVHETKSNMIRLDPFRSNTMFGRAGFLIHGRGVIGSHGCIVPYDFRDVVAIYNAVKAYNASHTDKPVLSVVAISAEIDRQISTA